METLAEKLQQLKQDYINGVTVRFNNIGYSLDQLDLEPSDYKALKNLVYCFYGLSGTGTTYGFPEVTLLGDKGQTECEILIKNNLPPSKCDIERWKNYLLELKRSFLTKNSTID